jgi:uncharacterized phiE125 gp8 family phage protein
MRINVITPGAGEPVDLELAKRHLRLQHDEDDVLIAGQITAARVHVESLLGYPMVESSMRATLDAFPCVIALPLCPIGAVSAVTYVDADGAAQTLPGADYKVDQSGRGARIAPAYGKSWPSTRREAAAVHVDYTAGYALADVPKPLVAAMLLLIGDMYENAEAQVVGSIIAKNDAADNLVFPYRIILP